ncbi:MAG: hypothetical protein ACP5D2_03900 [Candidatus Nanoarchaeia archaeon]
MAEQKPVWVKMDEKQLKKIIAELSKTYPASQIGLILRDSYGIPTTRLYGKKLKQYLKEQGIETNEELESMEKKVNHLKKHIQNNITDKKAKHKLQKAQSRLNKLRKHYA